MRWLFNLFLLSLVAAGGFFWSQRPQEPKLLAGIHPERVFPVTQFRSFAFIVYGRNCAPWCDRVLRSLYGQHYDHFRVLFIDDASEDHTYETAQMTTLACNEDARTLLIRNETEIGASASFRRAMDVLLDREIAIPLQGTDWLTDTELLSRLNALFQNPDVWLVEGGALCYPQYVPHPDLPFLAFYSALYKQLPSSAVPPLALLHLAGGRVQQIQEPCLFWNEALGVRGELPPLEKPLEPLIAFPDLK